MRPNVFARQNPPAVTSWVRSGTLNVVGHATFGRFINSTSTVSGVMTGNWSNLRGWVETPVGTLVTHNRHRDGDRRASMEAAKYPVPRFDLDLANYRTGSLTRTSGLRRMERSIEVRADLQFVRRRRRIPRSAGRLSAAVPAFYSIMNEDLVS